MIDNALSLIIVSGDEMKWTDLNVVREVLIDSSCDLTSTKFSWFADYLQALLSRHGCGYVCLREGNQIRFLVIEGGNSL